MSDGLWPMASVVCPLLLEPEAIVSLCAAQRTGSGAFGEKANTRDAHATVTAGIELKGGRALRHADEALMHVRFPEHLIQMQHASIPHTAILQLLLVLHDRALENKTHLLRMDACRHAGLVLQLKDRVGGLRVGLNDSPR